MILQDAKAFELHLLQKEAALHYFENLDLSMAEKIIEKLAKTPGMLFFSGLGKSGIVAEKIAKTLASIGKKALFLHPVEALHGDLGLVGEGDLLVVLSKSGEGKELAELMRATLQKGAEAMLWSSKPFPLLASFASSHMVLPHLREICPFDLAPTTSSTAQMLFGDLVAMALMKESGLSLKSYAMNHPGGSIGKSIALKVKDVMILGENLPLVAPSATLGEALAKASQKQLGSVFVAEKSILLGIFTDGDLRRLLSEENASGKALLKEPIQRFMNRNFLSVPSTMLASEAFRIMQDGKKRVLVLPVVEEGILLGLLTLHDLARYFR